MAGGYDPICCCLMNKSEFFCISSSGFFVSGEDGGGEFVSVLIMFFGFVLFLLQFVH